MPNKSILITGGAGAIGNGIAEACLHNGYDVIIADIDETKGRKLESERIRFFKTDVSDESSVIELKSLISKTNTKLFALINNAGIAKESNTPIEELSLEEWNKKIGTNLSSVFLMTKHFASLLEEGAGSIINISSIRAFRAEENTEAYMASKAGLIGLTKALAASFQGRLRVNSISPGWIHNPNQGLAVPDEAKDFHFVKRVGTVNDVAEMVMFLISDKASFITGQDFLVDGGISSKLYYPG